MKHYQKLLLFGVVMLANHQGGHLIEDWVAGESQSFIPMVNAHKTIEDEDETGEEVATDSSNEQSSEGDMMVEDNGEGEN